MSNYIVLVKQVPDVTQISDNAFNPQTGTLMRNKLPSVINELDTQALAFASLMKRLSNDQNAKIIALTMGPPMADDVLRYCLARGADSAVLLTDRALGGADTWATANPLSFAVKRIVKEFFNSSNDYFIVSGMQSVDGDTAQVPPQMAQELNIPCIAYSTGVEYKNKRFEFTRIISGGSQIVASRSMPCIITVAKYEYPLFASFGLLRKAKSEKLVQWGLADINPTAYGVSGSRTQVVRVFPPGKTTRKCLHVTSLSELADAICSSMGTAGAGQAAAASTKPEYVLPSKRPGLFNRNYEGTEKDIEEFKFVETKLSELGITDLSQLTDQARETILQSGKVTKKGLEDILAGLAKREPSYKGDVWVVAEHTEGVCHNATFELIGKARHLADSLGVKVGVAIAGSKLEHYFKDLIAAGADDVIAVEDPILSEFDPAAYRKALADAIGKYWPQIVLFAATPQGRVLAPLISYSLGCGLTADCTSLDIRDNSKKGEIAVLMQTRPALGGNVMATICTIHSKSQMATARPGVMKRLEPDYSRKGQVINHKVEFSPADLSLEIIKTELGHGSVNLGHAKAIVSGGKGMKNRDSYEQLLGMLGTTLSKKLGVEVERGASRAAVEQGFADRIRQVGQTGTSVGPSLYVALGISGAIQHMIGVSNSETIFAINSDPSAPIFKNCDYYYVGTVEQAVPELVKLLESK